MSKFRPTKTIDTIIVHCADSPNGAYWTAEDIDNWHGERKPPFKRDLEVYAAGNVSNHLKHIGYHFVIEVDGTLRRGRALTETGAHARGHNDTSIGICLVGRDEFTPEQWLALKNLINSLQTRFKYSLKIIGHRDVSPDKTCPGFDVKAWCLSGHANAPGCVVLYPMKPQEE